MDLIISFRFRQSHLPLRPSSKCTVKAPLTAYRKMVSSTVLSLIVKKVNTNYVNIQPKYQMYFSKIKTHITNPLICLYQ